MPRHFRMESPRHLRMKPYEEESKETDMASIIAGYTCPACNDKAEFENLDCTCGGVGYGQHVVGCPGLNPGAVYKCSECGAEMGAMDFAWRKEA